MLYSSKASSRLNLARPIYPMCAVLCVAQSCPTLCDPKDWSLPDSHVQGDSPGKNPGVGLHAPHPPHRVSSQPRDGTQVSCIPGGFFTA